jgi:hypothetical protein
MLEKYQTPEYGLKTDAIIVNDALTLHTVPIEHNPRTFLQFLEQYKKFVSDSDGLIIEYAPDKLRRLGQNPLVTFNPLLNFQEIAQYFSLVGEVASVSQKDMWCFDPAKAESFALIRSPQYAAIATSGGVGLFTGLSGEISRRQFLKAIGVLSAAACVAITAPIGIERMFSEPNPLYIDAEFRRITVSAGIAHLGEEFEKANTPKNLFVFTSPAQWKGIKNLLQGNGLKRRWNLQLETCSKMFNTLALHDFFTGTFYKYVGGDLAYKSIEYPIPVL